MAKQSKNFSKKYFSESFSESYQSPIPPSDFLHSSKYHLLKGLALAAAASLHWTQRKSPWIRLPDTAQGVISLVKLVHASCSVPLTPQKPQSHFQKRILHWKVTVVKKRGVQKQRVLDQQNWSAEELLTRISPISNQFYTVWLRSSVHSFLYSRVNINT